MATFFGRLESQGLREWPRLTVCCLAYGARRVPPYEIQLESPNSCAKVDRANIWNYYEFY